MMISLRRRGRGQSLGRTQPSPVPTGMAAAPQAALAAPTSTTSLLSQQALRLLEEARNENRMLEDAVATAHERVNMMEQEGAQLKEQAKIKEANLEEEIGVSSDFFLVGGNVFSSSSNDQFHK